MTDLPPQQLCEGEDQSQIPHSDIGFSEFKSLDPRQQEVVFDNLQLENARLHKVEERWDRFQGKCPRIDTQIYLSSTRIEPPEGQDERNGYNQQEAFQEKWSYITEDNYELGSRRSVDVRWHHTNIVSESPESDLEYLVYDSSIYFSGSSKQPASFSHRISSQLLLYRLTVTFGMTPLSVDGLDGYKSCWAVDLRHRDGVSVLSFQDFKGAADVRFDGTADANPDALELVNFLIGMNCPHPYDGIVAGSKA